MKNRFFTDDALTLLTDTNRWLVISSLMPGEVSPVDNPQHRQWMQTHTHSHENFQEVVIALQGQTFHGYRDEVYPVNPGTILVFDVKERHDASFPVWSPSFRHLGITTFANHILFRIATIHYQHGAIEPIRLVLPYDKILLNAQSLLFNQQYEAVLTPQIQRFRFCSALGVIISYLICKGFTESQDDECNLSKQQVISSIQQHIQETAGKGITVDALAALSGYCRSHFTYLFKQYIGMSVHDYINQCRIQKCQELVLQGHSHKVVASELGFSDPSTYARWKKKAFNKPATPGMPAMTRKLLKG